MMPKWSTIGLPTPKTKKLANFQAKDGAEFSSLDSRQISWILELKLRLYLLCFKASKGQQQQEQQQQQQQQRRRRRRRRRQQQLQQQKLAD